MTNVAIRPIHSAEEVFQFIQDQNEQRRQEIRNEEYVRILSMEPTSLRLN